MNKHLWIEFYDKELVDYCSLLVQRHRIVVMIMITVVFGQRKYAVNLYIHHHNHHLYVLCIKYGEALSKTFTTMFILQRYFKGFLPMTELSRAVSDLHNDKNNGHRPLLNQSVYRWGLLAYQNFNFNLLLVYFHGLESKQGSFMSLSTNWLCNMFLPFTLRGLGGIDDSARVSVYL